MTPAREATPGERKARVDEDGRARRGQAGDRLPGEAEDLTRVAEAQEGAEAAAGRLGLEPLPLHDGGRRAVDGERAALLRLPARAGVDRKGERGIGRAGELEGD